MFRFTIQVAGGQPRTLDVDSAQALLGRSDDCQVVLPASSVSRRHAKVVLREGRAVLADLKSANGTIVNGERLRRPKVVKATDAIQVGDFKISVELVGDEEDEVEETRPDVPPDLRDAALKPQVRSKRSRPKKKAPPRPVRPVRSPTASDMEQVDRRKAKRPSGPADQYASLLRSVHEQLIEAMDLKRLDIAKLGDDALRRRTETAIHGIVERLVESGGLPSGIDQERLISDVLNEALGLGPLEQFLADPSITEIMVNRTDQIYIERDGKLQPTDQRFSSDAAVYGIIERIVAPLGRRIDESSPLVDARLKDGSRVNAIIPPLAIKGPSITIRKFRREMFSARDLFDFGSISEPMLEFLQVCVAQRSDILISGGTGSGKTTTLNLISNFIPETERIVTIEDAAELQLKQDHLVSLESRPPNIEGKGQVAIRDLVRNALRMRPDRIIVGECRGGEALDMLQAMNTGHDGSLTTAHANSPRDALARLETMVLMAGMDLPVRAIREQIASAIDIIVQQSRMPDGSRKITHIVEVTGMEGDVITLQDIFLYEMTGFDDDGKVVGAYKPTGFIPRFYDELRARKVPVDLSIFQV